MGPMGLVGLMGGAVGVGLAVGGAAGLGWVGLAAGDGVVLAGVVLAGTVFEGALFVSPAFGVAEPAAAGEGVAVRSGGMVGLAVFGAGSVRVPCDRLQDVTDSSSTISRKANRSFFISIIINCPGQVRRLAAYSFVMPG